MVRLKEKPAHVQKNRGVVPPLFMYRYIHPLSAMLVAFSPPTTKWSSTRTSTRLSASRISAVMLLSDSEGSQTLTSPHEYGEIPKEFIDKTKAKMGSGRWCYAGPFQPNAFNNMPDVVESVRRFVSAFEPERVRVAFLSPNRHGVLLPDFSAGRDLLRELLSIPSVEVACVDARLRHSKGLFLADFFDFT